MKSLSKAEKLLYSLGITSPADIDLEAIAWTQNVLVKTRPLEGCEARIFGKGDVAIISVNENSRSTRQRFSIAHELGHWNNDRGMNFYCSLKDLEIGFKNSTLAERLANYFAADLLFPGFLFKPIVKQTSELNWDVIKDVSNDFNTSLTATAFRFIDSNEYPVILAVYNSKMERLWAKRPSQIPEKWYPKETISMPQSIKWNDPGLFPVSADYWFDQYECDEYEIEEQIFQYADQILALLTIKDERMLGLE